MTKTSKEDGKLPRKFTIKNIFGREDRTRESSGAGNPLCTTPGLPITEEEPSDTLEDNSLSVDFENWINSDTSTEKATADEIDEQRKSHSQSFGFSILTQKQAALITLHETPWQPLSVPAPRSTETMVTMKVMVMTMMSLTMGHFRSISVSQT
jgi:hypothetical protein